jgi:hypothetical protein
VCWIIGALAQTRIPRFGRSPVWPLGCIEEWRGGTSESLSSDLPGALAFLLLAIAPFIHLATWSHVSVSKLIGLFLDIAGIIQLDLSGAFEKLMVKYGNAHERGPTSSITRQIIDDPAAPIRTAVSNQLFFEHQTGFGFWSLALSSSFAVFGFGSERLSACLSAPRVGMLKAPRRGSRRALCVNSSGGWIRCGEANRALDLASA